MVCFIQGLKVTLTFKVHTYIIILNFSHCLSIILNSSQTYASILYQGLFLNSSWTGEPDCYDARVNKRCYPTLSNQKGPETLERKCLQEIIIVYLFVLPLFKCACVPKFYH